MNEITNTDSQIQNIPKPSLSDGDYEISAHYSKDMKVKRPKVTVYQSPQELPIVQAFSERNANLKLQNLKTDIYESEKKEEAKNGFNKKLYFKIFGGVTLATIIVSCLRKFGK